MMSGNLEEFFFKEFSDPSAYVCVTEINLFIEMYFLNS